MVSERDEYRAHVSNQLYDLQQARYSLLLCLRDRLDPGAIRCISSFMGEKFMHLYNLQNNISDGVGLAPMQLDMCTIKGASTLAPGESHPVWLHTNLRLKDSVAFLTRVNTRTLAVEHLTLNCGHEKFLLGPGIAKFISSIRHTSC